MTVIQGHRGFPSLYPENTLLSFRKAMEAGVFAIEMDIRVTFDNEYIIMHDTSVDRTTSGKGNVSELDWQYISTLDAGGKKNDIFAGDPECKVPTLDEVLTTYEAESVHLVLHLYVDTPEQAKMVVNKVVAKGMLSRVQFFSTINYINAVKAYEPNSFTVNSGMPNILNYQTYLDNAVANNHNVVSIDANETTENLTVMVNAIKAAGKLVQVSFVYFDYVKKMETYIDLGVDFVLGNDARTMQGVIDPPFKKIGSYFLKENTFINHEQGLIKASAYSKKNNGFVKYSSYKTV